MLDLVENPKDRFSRDKAQMSAICAPKDFSTYAETNSNYISNVKSCIILLSAESQERLTSCKHVRVM